MNISWLTLRDLEYVVAVAESRHFGRAAQACHVSQPALSAQIRKIETMLGLDLFERSNRKVMVTDAGAAVVDQARIVLQEARKLVEISSPSRGPLTGTLRLGAIATLGPYLMPHLLGSFRTQFPALNLLMKEGLTAELVHELKSGTLDAALMSPTVEDPSLRFIPLFFEPFWLAAPKDHPLLQRPHLGGRDLHPNEMVLLEDGHCLKNQTLDLCPANRRGGQRQFQATSIETLRHLVSSGFGYTVLPYLAIRDDPRLRKWIDYRQLEGKAPGREIVLACRKRFPLMGQMDMLAGFIREHLPKGLRAL